MLIFERQPDSRLNGFSLRRVRPLRRADLSAEVAQEQGARAKISRARCRPGGTIAALPRLAAEHPRRRRPQSRRQAIVDAKQHSGGILWGLGAHVIKTGLGPVLIDLMERGFVSAIATNGAAIIHDFEVALAGATSEDVDEALGPGRFGMAEETGRLLNDAINEGVASGLGIGQAVDRVSARPASRSSRREHAGRGGTARHPGHRPRRDRHGHHPHAPGGFGRGAWRGQPARLPVLRRQRRAARARGLPELRLGRRSCRKCS